MVKVIIGIVIYLVASFIVGFLWMIFEKDMDGEDIGMIAIVWPLSIFLLVGIILVQLYATIFEWIRNKRKE